MTINEALLRATKELKKSKIDTARLDAEVILVYCLRLMFNKKIDKTWLYQNLNNLLTPETWNIYKKLIDRRKKHEPIAYLINYKEFFKLNFWVDKNVLIPRSETELLVEEALKIIQNPKSEIRNPTIVDVGTGSGCIIITLVKNLLPQIANNQWQISFYATDISKKALKVAKKNAEYHQVDKKIKFFHGDLLEPLFQNPKSRIRNPNLIILANLPYLTLDYYQSLPGLCYEPKIALFGGKNGLELYHRLFRQVSTLVCIYQRAKSVSISVLIEIDPSQTQSIRRLIKKYLPNHKIAIKKDLAGKNRVVCIYFF